ncbi:hypothetical protein GVN16_08530 [Emticicia sp. CRIBPO]|uniref:C39 family peptidase n=1 Tax=Emticicia sp. CRIBPO TaxID=2683258 RepID=UPI0014123D5A|nr:C39 family peptidase [Emticicia sp. CRIBPO]NBA85802.1 hypothetical protein [Emticicia sp. CRIBPO]
MKISYTKILFFLVYTLSPILGRGQLRVIESSFYKCADLAKLDVIPQRHPHWCFAATSQMALTYFKKPVDYQYRIAETLVSATNVHNDACYTQAIDMTNIRIPSSSIDNWVEYLQSKGLQNARYHINMNTNILKNQLDNCNPVIGIFNVQGINDFHAMLIVGYIIGKDKGLFSLFKTSRTFFKVLDPLDPCQGCTYWIEYAKGEFKSSTINRIYAINQSRMITF